MGETVTDEEIEQLITTRSTKIVADPLTRTSSGRR
jgi:hypothetical protein